MVLLCGGASEIGRVHGGANSGKLTPSAQARPRPSPTPAASAPDRCPIHRPLALLVRIGWRR